MTHAQSYGSGLAILDSCAVIMIDITIYIVGPFTASDMDIN
jgi:hypothetical protein